MHKVTEKYVLLWYVISKPCTYFGINEKGLIQDAAYNKNEFSFNIHSFPP